MTVVSEFLLPDAGEARLAYCDTGSGTPLVLLHGGFLDRSMWDDQVSFLAKDHRVITPDARGHGASTVAQGPFRHTDDLAALLRHLDTGPAVLAGVSMGAALAVDTALEHPELVRALVISGAGTSEPEFRDAWALSIKAEQARALAAADAGRYVEALLQCAAGPRRSLDDVDQDVVRRLREMTVRTVAKHAGATRDWQVPVADTWARASRIAVPVLAVHGDLDADDHIGMAERLIRAVADGRAVTVEGAAHYPGMERPDAFNEILAAFLGTLPGADRRPG
ncbi:alpha/beta fold hydrolase [Streptomyces sp. bgisy100]|uniref:alpha/beta fold hydrolase n=1 Tax=Streptomyces sp. bgisy100 TaxID=3413783 RepID=UPI003D703C13